MAASQLVEEDDDAPASAFDRLESEVEAESDDDEDDDDDEESFEESFESFDADEEPLDDVEEASFSLRRPLAMEPWSFL